MKAAVWLVLATMGPCSSSVIGGTTTAGRATTIPESCNALAAMTCDGRPCDPNAADGEALATRRGPVSFYSDALAGRSTASGEPYAPSALTAASRDLPFGAVLRVTRIEGGQRVVVRVNDRGPFGRRTRVLDLSRAAARCLEMERAGVTDVRVEVIDWGPRGRPR